MRSARFGRSLPRLVLTLASLLVPMAAAAAPAPPTAGEEPAPADPAVELPPITVSGTRLPEDVFVTPQHTSVVTADDLARQGAADTPAALQELPGIQIQRSNHGGGSAVIRGFQGKHIVLLLDGIRLNNSVLYRYGPNQYLNTIDLFGVDHIEVVRGPLSVLHGSDALGGVINLVTPFDAFSERWQMHGRGRFEAHTADLSTAYRAEAYGAGPNVTMRAGATYLDRNELQGGAGHELQTPTGYAGGGADGAVRVRLAPGHTLRALVQYDQRIRVPRTDEVLNGKHSRYIFDPQLRALAALRYEAEALHPFVSGLNATVSYQRQVEGIEFVATALPTAEDRSLTAVDTLGVDLAVTTPLPAGNILTYGVDGYVDFIGSTAERETLATGATAARPTRFPDNSHYLQFGLFAQDIWHIDPQWRLTLGARLATFAALAELTTDTGLETTLDTVKAFPVGSASVQYFPVPEVAIILATGLGYRAPNMEDYTIFGEFGYGFEVPNPDLAPEKAWNSEVGLKFRWRGLEGSVFVAATYVTDLIDRADGTWQGRDYLDINDNGQRDGAELGIYRRANIAEAFVFNVEAALAYTFADDFTLWGNVGYTYGQDLTADTPLRRMTPVTGAAGLRWSHASRRGYAEILGRFAGKQDRLAPGDIKDARIGPDGTPGYFTLDVRAGFRPWSRALVALAGENLTNAAYKTHGSAVYGPGRSAVVRLELGF